MKKHIARLLVLALLLTSCMVSNVFALNYKANLDNEATFETMTEVRENAPAAMKVYSPNTNYIPHPVLANYPGDTTYVYRSPDMYGLNAAVRINTNLVVYTDESFETKDDAFAYLQNLGLIDIIDEARGSVVLVTPTAAGAGFSSADQKNYYALQTAIFSINGSETIDGKRCTYVDAPYYGGYGYYYVIGIGDGATFLNNFVSTVYDYATRIAGMLLVNGKMDRIRKVAAFLPVYLVNSTDAIIDKYVAANGADFIHTEGDKTIQYNHEYPVRKVVTLETEEVDLPALVQDAYYNLFIKAQRGQEILQGMYSASTPYQGNNADTVPYSLNVRNAMLNGRTADGIILNTVVTDDLADINDGKGEYLQTWYEYLPEEVLDGTAPDGTIPVILAWHGGGDDPRQYVEGQGLLEVAGRERVAIIAPFKESFQPYFSDDPVTARLAPVFIQYILDKYPALDASRVYTTGFSMGGMSTMQTVYGAAPILAAAFCQSGIRSSAPGEAEMAFFEGLELPFCCSTSEYNMGFSSNLGEGENFYAFVSKMCELEHLGALPEPDFEKYPVGGFKADISDIVVVNDDYTVYSWYQCNDKGIPMVGVTFIESINHALYPQHAEILWNFFKHYSRNLETGEVIYNPYVR